MNNMFIDESNEDEDYLAHYGVIGMHWGVRRYRNYDGTVINGNHSVVDKAKQAGSTIARGAGAVAGGVKKVASGTVKVAKAIASTPDRIEQAKADAHAKSEARRAAQDLRRMENERHTTGRKARKLARQAMKNRSAMTDAELNARIDRMEREKKLKELSQASLNPGREAAKQALAKGGTTLLSTAGSAFGKGIVDRLFGVVIDPRINYDNAKEKAENQKAKLENEKTKQENVAKNEAANQATEEAKQANRAYDAETDRLRSEAARARVYNDVKLNDEDFNNRMANAKAAYERATRENAVKDETIRTQEVKAKTETAKASVDLEAALGKVAKQKAKNATSVATERIKEQKAKTALETERKATYEAKRSADKSKDEYEYDRIGAKNFKKYL